MLLTVNDKILLKLQGENISDQNATITTFYEDLTYSHLHTTLAVEIQVGPQGPTGLQGPTGSQGLTGIQGFTGSQGQTGASSTIPGPTGAQGATGPQGTAGSAATTVRLFASNNSTNATAFYFNAITVTAAASANLSYETAYILNSSATSVTVYIRCSTAPGNTTISIWRNENATAFTSASLIATSTQNISAANTIVTYLFTGLTLNQFDSIHVRVAPTTKPDEVSSIIIQ